MIALTIFATVIIGLLSVVGAVMLGYHFGYARGAVAGLESTSTAQLVRLSQSTLEVKRQEQRREYAAENEVQHTVAFEPSVAPTPQPEPVARQPETQKQAVLKRGLLPVGGAYLDDGTMSASIPRTSL